MTSGEIDATGNPRLRWTAGTEVWVERDGVRVHARCIGTGPTVLLHTGGLGDGHMWQEYLGRLPGFRLVLLDHRGRGRSSRVGTVEGHRIEEYVADAVAVLRAVLADADEAAGVVGYSLGAQIGYALAARHPELVSAMVGLGGSWDPLPGTMEAESAAEHTAQMVRLLDDVGVGGFVGLIEDEEQLTVPDWLRAQFFGTDAEQFRLSLLGTASWDPWSVVEQIRCPTLLLCGELEDPDQTIGLAAQRLPDAQASWLPGLGHVGAFLAADAVAAHAVPFLRRCLTDP